MDYWVAFMKAIRLQENKKNNIQCQIVGLTGIYLKEIFTRNYFRIDASKSNYNLLWGCKAAKLVAIRNCPINIKLGKL